MAGAVLVLEGKMIVHPEEYDPEGSVSCNGCPRLREKWKHSYATCPGCERLAEARGETDDTEDEQ